MPPKAQVLPNKKPQYEKTAVEAAGSKGKKTESSSVKKESDKGLSSHFESAIYKELFKKNANLNAVLAKHAKDINAKDQYRQTLLHIAAFQDRAEIIIALIVAGADPNKTNQFGCFPLQIAVDSHGTDAACVKAFNEGIRLKRVADEKLAEEKLTKEKEVKPSQTKAQEPAILPEIETAKQHIVAGKTSGAIDILLNARKAYQSKAIQKKFSQDALSKLGLIQTELVNLLIINGRVEQLKSLFSEENKFRSDNGQMSSLCIFANSNLNATTIILAYGKLSQYKKAFTFIDSLGSGMPSNPMSDMIFDSYKEFVYSFMDVEDRECVDYYEKKVKFNDYKNNFFLMLGHASFLMATNAYEQAVALLDLTNNMLNQFKHYGPELKLVNSANPKFFLPQHGLSYGLLLMLLARNAANPQQSNDPIKYKYKNILGMSETRSKSPQEILGDFIAILPELDSELFKKLLIKPVGNTKKKLGYLLVTFNKHELMKAILDAASHKGLNVTSLLLACTENDESLLDVARRLQHAEMVGLLEDKMPNTSKQTNTAKPAEEVAKQPSAKSVVVPEAQTFEPATTTGSDSSAVSMQSTNSNSTNPPVSSASDNGVARHKRKRHKKKQTSHPAVDGSAMSISGASSAAAQIASASEGNPVAIEIKIDDGALLERVRDVM